MLSDLQHHLLYEQVLVRYHEGHPVPHPFHNAGILRILLIYNKEVIYYLREVASL